MEPKGLANPLLSAQLCSPWTLTFSQFYMLCCQIAKIRGLFIIEDFIKGRPVPQLTQTVTPIKAFVDPVLYVNLICHYKSVENEKNRRL